MNDQLWARGALSAALVAALSGCDGSGAPLNSQQVQQALPDARALPAGWSADHSDTRLATGDDAVNGCRYDTKAGCEGVLVVAKQEVERPGGDSATVGLQAFGTPDGAGSRYGALVDSLGGKDDLTEIDLPAVGDESHAYQDSDETRVVLRVGTVVAVITDESRGTDVAQRLAAMQAERIEQVQGGSPADATYR
ncbi:hypothetical protein HUO13_12925 [Saccharopolyspora erythraea]|uniref:hypothetical protein n=1 Tax=Saccharopolyspora erythraea TaxID=1836 RepID=UPI001BA747A9|nr:hypothetical protein [Saccharopolyspora erythraea]QUH01597.1 hypothetical protein HUO13_12925 [Saccharopolyspora erythraea]